MTRPHFTTREKAYAFIVRYKQAHDGCPPTLDEIAAACGVSQRAIRRHVKRLEAEGLITIDRNHNSRIGVVGALWLGPNAPELEEILLSVAGMENLPYGDPGSPERRLWHAVRAARMHLADAEAARDRADQLYEENRQLRDNHRQRRRLLAVQADRIKALEREIARLERDLEWLQDAIDQEVIWWKGKASYFYHMAAPRLIALPATTAAELGPPHDQERTSDPEAVRTV